MEVRVLHYIILRFLIVLHTSGYTKQLVDELSLQFYLIGPVKKLINGTKHKCAQTILVRTVSYISERKI